MVHFYSNSFAQRILLIYGNNTFKAEGTCSRCGVKIPISKTFKLCGICHNYIRDVIEGKLELFRSRNLYKYSILVLLAISNYSKHKSKMAKNTNIIGERYCMGCQKDLEYGIYSSFFILCDHCRKDKQ